MTLPKLAPVKDYETTELDFRSTPKNMLESNCGGNNATTSICVSNQGGGIFFCYDGGSCFYMGSLRVQVGEILHREMKPWVKA